MRNDWTSMQRRVCLGGLKEEDSQDERILDGWGETLMYELMGLYIFGQINLFKLFIPPLCGTPFILYQFFLLSASALC